MHGVVGTNLGPSAKEQSRAWKKDGALFLLPILFPTGLKLKSMEEKAFSTWNP